MVEPGCSDLDNILFGDERSPVIIESVGSSPRLCILPIGVLVNDEIVSRVEEDGWGDERFQDEPSSQI